MGTLCKVYDICLKTRLEDAILHRIPREQTAYQYERRGCEEHIFTSKVLCEQYKEKLIILLTDFSKAFNSVCNFVIHEALKKLEVAPVLVNAVYDATKYFVTVDHDTGAATTHTRGVPQGGTTSGILFLAALFTLTERLNNANLSNPIFVGDQKLTHLLFADDCQLLSVDKLSTK